MARIVATARVVSLLAILASASPAWALVVNVDINHTGPTPTYSGPGAATDPGNTFWNGVPVGPSTGLFESDGVSPTSLSLNVAAPSSDQGAPSGAFADALFRDYAYVFNPTAALFTLSGVPNAPGQLYDLYLYSLNGNANNNVSTTFLVDGIPKTATPIGLPGSFVEGGNYVRYTNLAPSVLGEISGTFQDNAGSAGTFNGLQLVSVPEPAAALALLASFAGLPLLRRRA